MADLGSRKKEMKDVVDHCWVLVCKCIYRSALPDVVWNPGWLCGVGVDVGGLVEVVLGEGISSTSGKQVRITKAPLTSCHLLLNRRRLVPGSKRKRTAKS